MDRHGKYPVLERGHDVHGPLQRVRDARADAQRRHGRRRGIFRTGQLFAAGAVPRQDAGLRHVGPPDGLLHRHHHQRLCRGLYWTAVGLAQRLLRLRRRRRRARRHHGRAAEGQEGAGCRRRRVGRGAQASVDGGFRMVFTTPTALILTVCFAGLIFVLTGYLTWMPTYLYENFGMDLAGAGFHSMFYTHLFAFVGVLLAGRLSDKLGSLHPAWRMAMQGFGLLAAVPFIVLMGNSATLWVIYIGFAGFGFARAFFDANTYTVLYDVILPRYHSSASGVMIMTGFAIGALAPLVLGMVKQAAGLSFGISMLAVVWLVCGVVMLLGAKYFYMRDYNKIRHE